MTQPTSKLPERSKRASMGSTNIQKSTPSASTGPTSPPKSKTQPYYSISPLWADVEPIPQIDSMPGIPDSVPVLAPIAYTPRYAEAMSYLRAVMAANEYSERCLALTEDLISMNPAHYTVWIYRMRILKHLWGIPLDQIQSKETVDFSSSSTTDPDLEAKVMKELTWLNSVSARNLKNYQIWHHRHSLVALLSLPPTSSFFNTEQIFLRQILSLDTKNYHVWSYRQWLCTRFPDPLLDTDMELRAMNEMITDDVRNNSAWNHRYFIIFGHKELKESERLGKILKDILPPPLTAKSAPSSTYISTHITDATPAPRSRTIMVMDQETVHREMEYTQTQIRLAPQNPSPWNYLKGIARYYYPDSSSSSSGLSRISIMRNFCEEFIGPDGDLWSEHTKQKTTTSDTGQSLSQTDDGEEGDGRGVRSSHAIEWLSDIYAYEGTPEGKKRAVECLKSLGEKWDPIRRKYWEYRVKQLQKDFDDKEE